MEKNNALIEYRKIRDEIDKKVEILETQHRKHLKCASGCDMCCMDYRIFPVEFFSILDELKSRAVAIKPETGDLNDEDCVFLKNHKCTIYSSRPIICRTHGLPLLFANDDGDWELSACELNFTDFDFSEFTFDNTFPQDKFNSRLFLVNKDFIKSFNKKYGEFELIRIKNLLNEL